MRVRLDEDVTKKVKQAMKANKRKSLCREVNMALTEFYSAKYGIISVAEEDGRPAKVKHAR